MHPRKEGLDAAIVRSGATFAFELMLELGVQEDETERMEGARDELLLAESARFSTLRRAWRNVDVSSDLKPESVEARLCRRLREASSAA